MAFNSYILSESASQSIFDTDIVPTELHPVQHLHHQIDGKQPLAVLLVGQTGAGKTRLAPIIKSAMIAINRTPAHFIADTYKAYHPAYAGILSSTQPPGIASAATGVDARRWLTMACAYAIAHRIDVLVESACRHPDDFCGLATAFHEGGYRVQVAIMAVPEALSRIGILVRFHQNLPEAKSGKLPLRLTPRKVHDDSYVGLEDAARFIDEAAAADKVIVVRRGILIAYENQTIETETEGRVWEGPALAARALAMERKRPLMGDELGFVVQDLEMLEGLNDPSTKGQVEEIQSLIAPLKKSVGDPGAAASTEKFPELKPLNIEEFVGAGLV